MIKKDNYERIAECIRGEQMSAPEIADLFEDGQFLKWYRRKYRLNFDRDDTSQEEWLEGYNKWQTKKERCPHN
jgi:predicted metal-binding protein